MSIRSLTLAESICLLYLFVLQHNLIDSWVNAPFERGSWIPLLLWLLPFFLYRLGLIGCSKQTHSHPILVCLSVCMATLGVMISVHTLKNLAFVIVIGAFVPFSSLSVVWIVSALGWMRPLGYLGSYYFADYILPIRFLIVLPATLLFIRWLINRGEVRETA